jgi:hypothetical protein
MFNKSVISSDDFVDMPATTQMLYFHLSMAADDEGFFDNGKQITRMVGASSEDFQLLINNGYIISFDKGISAIVHWNENNLIRKDKYTKTIYQDQLALLEVDSNGRYKVRETAQEGQLSDTAGKWQENGRKMAGIIPPNNGESTALIKYNIIKDNNNIIKDNNNININSIDNLNSLNDTHIEIMGVKGEEEKTEAAEPQVRVNYQEVADAYNELCPSLPSVKNLNDSRRRAIKARLKTFGINGLKDAFVLAEESDFLTGRIGRGWTANFDWLMKETNLTKVVEGTYANRDSPHTHDDISNRVSEVDSW